MSNVTEDVGCLEMLINGAVNASFGAIGLIANLLIVGCFLRVPRIRAENCAYLIVSIALTDLLFSGSVIAQSVQNIVHPMRSEQVAHCFLSQVAAMLATAAGATFLACFAVDRYEAACEPYDYQLKDHFKFGVYSLMVSCCFGCLVTVMFTSLGSHLAVLSTTSCPSPNRVMQSYWWAFELTAGVIVLLLMIRASVRISVQIKYADNNSSGTVRAIAKQGRITTVAALVVVVSVVTGLFPHIAALILTMNPSSTYFNQVVLYLGSASALGAALRPIVAITQYRALRSHIGRAFRRHSSNTAVGPHMELFAVERKDRQSVITLY